MSQDVLDLTGDWSGYYSYPGGAGPTTAFVARIEENDGHFSGTIAEPSLYPGQQTAHATIAGVRSGTGVDFVKTYAGMSIGYERPVDYVGQISADGCTITGMWSLLDMNGRFEMTRDEAAEEPFRTETTEELPV